MRDIKRRRLRLAVSLFLITLLVFVVLFGGTYYLFLRANYDWHEDFELNLKYQGNMITVDINGSEETDDLNDALLMVEDGDTIVLLPGEYNGTFFIQMGC